MPLTPKKRYPIPVGKNPEKPGKQAGRVLKLFSRITRIPEKHRELFYGGVIGTTIRKTCKCRIELVKPADDRQSKRNPRLAAV